MAKQLLFSVTKNDFEMQVFRSGGKGGQNQNKVSSGVRLIHRESGARGEARDSRDQVHNKRNAFLRLLETKEWKNWYRIECARRLGADRNIEKEVEESLKPNNLRIEAIKNNKWIPYMESENVNVS
jgi:protein subunit release factor B